MHYILRAHFGCRLLFFFWNVYLVYKYRHGGLDRDGEDMDQRKVRDGLTNTLLRDCYYFKTKNLIIKKCLARKIKIHWTAPVVGSREEMVQEIRRDFL